MIYTRHFRPRSPVPRKLRDMRLAYSEARSRLWDLPNVVGLGLGFKKTARRVNYRSPCFVVHVSHKHEMPDIERIPALINGIPTDVQHREVIAEANSFNGGGHVRAVGETAEGRLGVLVRRSNGAIAALTAAHVLFPDRFPVAVAESDQAVEAHGLLNSWVRIGKVVAARYDRGRDAALIEVTNNDFDRAVGGGGLIPLEPRHMVDGDQGKLPAQLAIDVEGALPSGWLSNRNYAGKIQTRAAGEKTFEALCQFHMDHGVEGQPAERGFSGGLICDVRGAPLALLSFAGRVDGEAVAFGWPITRLYSDWSLRCI